MINDQKDSQSESRNQPQMSVLYKITPASLRKHSMHQKRIEYHLNKSYDPESNVKAIYENQAEDVKNSMMLSNDKFSMYKRKKQSQEDITSVQFTNQKIKQRSFQNQSVLIQKYASHHLNEDSTTHPYESHYEATEEEDNHSKTNLPNLRENSLMSQSNLGSIIKQARSVSRQFFSKRPKTQMLEINQKQNKQKCIGNVGIKDSDNGHFETGSVEGSIFGNLENNFQSAIAKQIEQQNSLTMLQKGQQSALIQQQQINQKLLKKQINQLTHWLDQKEFDFENNYGISQYDPDKQNVDRKEVYQEYLKVYEEGSSQFIQQVLKKSSGQQVLLERMISGIKFCMQKLNFFTELEVKQNKLEISQLNKELEIMTKKNLILQQEILQEEKYLQTMFEKSKKGGLEQVLAEYENMKSLSESIKESNFLSNLFKQVDNNGDLSSTERRRQQADYSGVQIQLRDLYQIMNSNVQYERIGDFQLDIKSDQVVDKFQHEIQEKFINIQNMTAKKVLSRFYKKIVQVDNFTQVDEDPVEFEKKRLERMIENLRNDRDKDFQKMSVLQSQHDQLNKQLNSLQTQVRENKNQLSTAIDAVEKKEGEMKEMKAQIRYQEDQISKYMDQVKELMRKCDDYEFRVDTYKESLQRAERKMTKRQIKLNIAVEEKMNHEQKIKELEYQINDLQYSLKRKDQGSSYIPRRKPVMVKKPIFDIEGKVIGEAFVEQMMTVRSDVSNIMSVNKSIEIDDEDEVKSDFSINTEEREELKRLIDEQMEESSEVNQESKEEIKRKLDSWFKSDRRLSLKDVASEIQIVSQFKDKLKETKNQRRLSIRKKKSLVQDQNEEQEIVNESFSKKESIHSEKKNHQFLSVEQAEEQVKTKNKQNKVEPKTKPSKKSVEQTTPEKPKQKKSQLNVNGDEQKPQSRSLSPTKQNQQVKTQGVRKPSTQINDQQKDYHEISPYQSSIQQQQSKSQSPVRDNMQPSYQKQQSEKFQAQQSNKYEDSPREPIVRISSKQTEELRIQDDNNASRNFTVEQNQSIKRINTLLQKAPITKERSIMFEDTFGQPRQRTDISIQQTLTQQKSVAQQVYHRDKNVQTEITGDIQEKLFKNGHLDNCISTQTEEFMFPMDEELKKKVMEIIGGRLPKYGDQYDRGSAYFSRAAALIDEIESKYQIEDDITKIRAANGIIDPKYKQFKPVLAKLKQPNKLL